MIGQLNNGSTVYSLKVQLTKVDELETYIFTAEGSSGTRTLSYEPPSPLPPFRKGQRNSRKFLLILMNSECFDMFMYNHLKYDI